MKRFLSTVAVCAVGTTAFAGGHIPEAVEFSREMVVTANPLATEAGAEILKQGGTAVDAMIAVQTVLGLVEPQSSGIGGGAFVVYYDAASDELITVDARETAPIAATEDRFSGLNFFAAWQSGLSVGVPGVPAMMELLHDRYGQKPWQRLFVPAKTLAQSGFEITERTASQVDGLLARNASCSDRLFFRDPVAFEYFTNGDLENCTAKPAGTKVVNPDYADLMKRLGELGAEDGFYNGPVADAVVEAVQTDLAIPGDMMAEDLSTYLAVVRDPVCIDYRGYEVCGMGPPSSGALAVGQILGILENFTLSGGPLDDLNVHLFAQAGRLAFADRGLYVGDTDYVTVPVEGMLDKDYLASRAALITDMDMGTASPGTPPGAFDPTAPQFGSTDNGTSHVSIVDRYGNALSMTTTIESSFGNGVMVPGWGFLLNNELTDFSFAAESNGVPIANRVQSGKRPRSSMSPTIVFDGDGEVFLVTGSPGGSAIIGYTAQSIVNVIDFGLDPQEAVNVPHYQNRNGSTSLESPVPGATLDYDVDALRAALVARGHPVSVGALTSGLSVILVTDEGLIGGADFRRDGAVGGTDLPPGRSN